MNAYLVSFLIAAVALSAVNAVPAEKATQAKETTASNVTAPAPDMAEALVNLLRAFRKVMPCGDPSLNIPILAPFRLNNIPVNISHELLMVEGSINNLVMMGINDFVIINMATNATTNRTTFDVLYKGFQIVGDFDLAVNADMAGYRFIQNLKGQIDLQVQNVRLTGGMTIGVNKVGGMLFSDIDYYVQVGAIISDTLETEWSVAVNNFVNRYIGDASMLFLQTNRELVSELVAAYATPRANEAFYNISASEYIEGMVEATEMYNSIDCSP